MCLIEMNFLGIDDVLALRGDPQKGSRRFIPEKDGHTYTFELVNQIVNMNNGKYLEESLARYFTYKFLYWSCRLS